MKKNIKTQKNASRLRGYMFLSMCTGMMPMNSLHATMMR